VLLYQQPRLAEELHPLRRLEGVLNLGDVEYRVHNEDLALDLRPEPGSSIATKADDLGPLAENLGSLSRPKFLA
jgi:hypothetical protein